MPGGGTRLGDAGRTGAAELATTGATRGRERVGASPLAFVPGSPTRRRAAEIGALPDGVPDAAPAAERPGRPLDPAPDGA